MFKSHGISEYSYVGLGDLFFFFKKKFFRKICSRSI